MRCRPHALAIEKGKSGGYPIGKIFHPAQAACHKTRGHALTMPDVRSFSATFLVTTPLFLGGAGQEAEGFRLASLKGAVRFWWRTLVYPDLFLDAVHAGAAPQEARRRALESLRRAEMALFGSTGAQSRVLMRLAPRRTPLARLDSGAELKAGDGRRVGPGACYLGYGLMGAYGENAAKLARSCLSAGQCVRVEFRFKAGADVDSFRRALILFGLVGNLGSRARRGWGGLALVALDGAGPDWHPPTTEDAYRAALRAVLPRDLTHAEPFPPFTAFGPGSRIDLLGTDADGLATLDRMGRAMQRYRSWGHKGQVNNCDSEQNFREDHDWSKDPFGSKFRSFVPRRVVFGLPQNYGKDFGVAPAEARMDRRASPLFLHVHPLAADCFLAVALVLPAEFLPGGRGDVAVNLRGRSDRRRAEIDWRVLDGFLDGPVKRERFESLGAYFPRHDRVLPAGKGGR